MALATQCIDYRTNAEDLRSKCYFSIVNPPSRNVVFFVDINICLVGSMRISEKRIELEAKIEANTMKRIEELEAKLEASTMALEEAKAKISATEAKHKRI
jgi:hypothetical protein